jgi:hypothetical protein
VTFFWAVQERPRRPGDVFLRPDRTPRPDAQTVSAAAEEEEEETEEDEYIDLQSRKRNRK